MVDGVRRTESRGEQQHHVAGLYGARAGDHSRVGGDGEVGMASRNGRAIKGEEGRSVGQHGDRARIALAFIGLARVQNHRDVATAGGSPSWHLGVDLAVTGKQDGDALPAHFDGQAAEFSGKLSVHEVEPAGAAHSIRQVEARSCDGEDAVHRKEVRTAAGRIGHATNGGLARYEASALHAESPVRRVDKVIGIGSAVVGGVASHVKDYFADVRGGWGPFDKPLPSIALSREGGCRYLGSKLGFSIARRGGIGGRAGDANRASHRVKSAGLFRFVTHQSGGQLKAPPRRRRVRQPHPNQLLHAGLIGRGFNGDSSQCIWVRSHSGTVASGAGNARRVAWHPSA